MCNCQFIYEIRDLMLSKSLMNLGIFGIKQVYINLKAYEWFKSFMWTYIIRNCNKYLQISL